MIRIIALIFVVFSIVSCQQKQDNIVLTDFTKELISLFIDTHIDDEIETNRQHMNRNQINPEIIIWNYVGALRYALAIHFNTARDYKCWNGYEDKFIGQTAYRGFRVRVFGEKESVFYSVERTIERRERCRGNLQVSYEPPTWLFVLYKDLSFCKMRTFKVAGNKDISDIQSLAERHFNVSTCMPEMHENEFFWDVENPPKFALGEDSLRNLISSNFKIRREYIQNRVPIMVNIEIDKNGKATVRGLIRGVSTDIELNNEALRVAEIITQHEFIPASHRGHIVNSTYTIFFRESDFVRKKTE